MSFHQKASYEQFFFQECSWLFCLWASQQRKRFYNRYPMWHLKNLTQAFSIIDAVFYCFFKRFSANLKRPKVANSIRPNQGKPFCMVNMTLVWQNFREKRNKRDRNIWNSDFIFISFFFSVWQIFILPCKKIQSVWQCPATLQKISRRLNRMWHAKAA